MPTKQKLTVSHSKDPKKARISISFEFNQDDPRATSYYAAIGTCLRIALNDEECREFLQRLDAEKQKLVAHAPR